MKIVIAPDSYKGSLSATEVCEIVERALCMAISDTKVCKMPLSDGGEGLVRTLVNSLGGRIVKKNVNDPLFHSIDAEYGILESGTAIIEMAAASGLPSLAENERNPMITSSYGTGQLIADAVSNGCRSITLGLGGSATNDGGIGAAAALGVRFLDKNRNEVPLSGKGLASIEGIEVPDSMSKYEDVRITLACDVDNPLTGTLGAAEVYGRQKGADDGMVKELDRGLGHFNTVLKDKTGMDWGKLAGTGAAGGFSLPFIALLKAELKSGLDIVLDTMCFEEVISDADLIITGEGKTDSQSAMGKVIAGVSQRAKAYGVPVIAISGALDEGYEQLYEMGLTAAFSTWKAGHDLDWQMAHAGENLFSTALNVLRILAEIGVSNSRDRFG